MNCLRPSVRVLAAVAGLAGLASCSLPSAPTHAMPEPVQAGSETALPAPAPASAPAPTVSAVMTLADARRVQAEVMDFADDMTIRLAEAVDQIETVPLPIEARVVAHRIKYTVAHGATIIAAAQNPRIALVDMLVMITLQRALIERNIVPQFYGSEADRLRFIFEASERQIRGLAERSLTAEQLGEIDRLIEQWLGANPDRRYAAYVRFSEFAEARQVVTGQRGSGGRPSNVLGFLFIDPLSGLDPTTREIEQARLFAERAFFYLQRMPVLISWQAELLYIDTVSEPEVAQLVANAATISQSVETLTAEVEAIRAQLPEMIATERAAALDRIAEIIDTQRTAAIEQAFEGLRLEREALLDQIASGQDDLGVVLTDLRKAIESGTELSESLRQTARSLSELAVTLRLDQPKDPNAEPFRIQNYTEAMRETTRAAIELATLTESLAGATSPELLEARLALVEQRLAEAELAAERLMDRAFRLVLMLILLLVAGLIGVVVVAALLRRRPVTS